MRDLRSRYVVFGDFESKFTFALAALTGLGILGSVLATLGMPEWTLLWVLVSLLAVIVLFAPATRWLVPTHALPLDPPSPSIVRVPDTSVASTSACSRVAELLGDYLEGTLLRPDAELLERHIEGCGPCTEFVNTYRATTSATRARRDAIARKRRLRPAARSTTPPG